MSRCFQTQLGSMLKVSGQQDEGEEKDVYSMVIPTIGPMKASSYHHISNDCEIDEIDEGLLISSLDVKQLASIERHYRNM